MRILWRAVSYLLPHKPRVFISCAAASHFYRVSLSGSSYMFPVCSGVLLLAGWLPLFSLFLLLLPLSFPPPYIPFPPCSSLLHIYIYTPRTYPAALIDINASLTTTWKLHTWVTFFWKGDSYVLRFSRMAIFMYIYTVAYNFRPYMYVFLSLFFFLVPFFSYLRLFKCAIYSSYSPVEPATSGTFGLAIILWMLESGGACCVAPGHLRHVSELSLQAALAPPLPPLSVSPSSRLPLCRGPFLRLRLLPQLYLSFCLS